MLLQSDADTTRCRGQGKGPRPLTQGWWRERSPETHSQTSEHRALSSEVPVPRRGAFLHLLQDHSLQF